MTPNAILSLFLLAMCLMAVSILCLMYLSLSLVPALRKVKEDAPQLYKKIIGDSEILWAAGQIYFASNPRIIWKFISHLYRAEEISKVVGIDKCTRIRRCIWLMIVSFPVAIILGSSAILVGYFKVSGGS